LPSIESASVPSAMERVVKKAQSRSVALARVEAWSSECNN